MTTDDKVILLLICLINGCRITLSQGTIIGMDDDYKPYCVMQDENGNEVLISPFVDYTISWLASEAEKLDESEFTKMKQVLDKLTNETYKKIKEII